MAAAAIVPHVTLRRALSMFFMVFKRRVVGNTTLPPVSEMPAYFLGKPLVGRKTMDRL